MLCTTLDMSAISNTAAMKTPTFMVDNWSNRCASHNIINYTTPVAFNSFVLNTTNGLRLIVDNIFFLLKPLASVVPHVQGRCMPHSWLGRMYWLRKLEYSHSIWCTALQSCNKLHDTEEHFLSNSALWMLVTLRPESIQAVISATSLGERQTLSCLLHCFAWP